MKKRALSIILLICLMILFVPQQVKADAFWIMMRPVDTGEIYNTFINETISDSYTDGKASVGLGTHIVWYHENDPSPPFDLGEGDGLDMKIVATANSRKMLQYDVYTTDSYDWHGSLWYTINNLCDDYVYEIPMEIRFRFYGGVGSGEYDKVQVSSNGVVFFNYTRSCNTQPYYYGFVANQPPHSFAAPFWKDLKPDAQSTITYGTVYHTPAGKDCFVISWNNIPDKNGYRQTFQVVMEPAPVWTAPGCESYHQSRIWFQYNTITLNDPKTIVGIEDQEGYKWTSYNYNNLANGTALRFDQWDGYCALAGLTIKLTMTYAGANDNYALVYVDRISDDIRGVNVRLNPKVPTPTLDPNARFALALASGAALLIPGAAGFIIGSILWAPSMVEALAGLGYQAGVTIVDGTNGWPVSNAAVVCEEKLNSTYSQLSPVDAWFGIHIYWIFFDDNSDPVAARSHSLNVTAQLCYQEFNYYGTPVGSSKLISASAKLDVISPWGGGGGGCPFVSTWNGDGYVLDNNLLPASEYSGGFDVNDYYVLQQMLTQRQDGTYSLLLSEFEHEHDFFDKVQLFAVDHSSNVNVAVSPYGEILTYTNPNPPLSAITNEDKNVKALLNAVDGKYYEGYNGSYITLNFASVDTSNGAKLVIREEDPEDRDGRKSPVYIQTLNSAEEWQTVATIYTRRCWSTEIVNMTKYLPEAKINLKVRLCFTSHDRIDFAGLDTTPQATINIQQAELVSATHSQDGDVKSKLLSADGVYAELLPGNQIELTFTLPSSSTETRTFILYTKGHYVKTT